MNNLALIPARGGSKRLPRKNIKLLNGKPLIAYTIQTCLSVDSISRVIVSTEDEEIAKVAVEYGAEVPFFRPDVLAADSTGDRAVLLHAIHWFEDNEGQRFDNILYMRPTTPFKTVNMLESALEKMKDDRFSSIRSVSRVGGVYHPYWMYKRCAEYLMPFVNEVKIEKYYQSQMLPECFRLNGVVDVTRTATVKKYENIYGNAIGFIEIEEKQAVDIDTEFDFSLCEFMLERGLIR